MVRVTLDPQWVYKCHDIGTLQLGIRISLHEIGGTVKWWTDPKTGLQVYELEKRPRDVPICMVFWNELN